MPIAFHFTFNRTTPRSSCSTQITVTIAITLIACAISPIIRTIIAIAAIPLCAASSALRLASAAFQRSRSSANCLASAPSAALRLASAAFQRSRSSANCLASASSAALRLLLQPLSNVHALRLTFLFFGCFALLIFFRRFTG